jgi:hypothetical protein
MQINEYHSDVRVSRNTYDKGSEGQRVNAEACLLHREIAKRMHRGSEGADVRGQRAL